MKMFKILKYSYLIIIIAVKEDENTFKLMKQQQNNE